MGYSSFRVSDWINAPLYNGSIYQFCLVFSSHIPPQKELEIGFCYFRCLFLVFNSVRFLVYWKCLHTAEQSATICETICCLFLLFSSGVSFSLWLIGTHPVGVFFFFSFFSLQFQVNSYLILLRLWLWV